MTGQRSPILARFTWEKLFVGTVLEADAARKPERIKQRLFNGEFAIHFRGLEDWTNLSCGSFRKS